MRVAIIHYWLLNRRGGEKVLDALCRLLPDADIFTLFCDPETLSPEVRKHRVTASFLNPLKRRYRSLLPLMPMALESFDLRGYDLIVSSESGPAKGIIAPSSARHICYCHTPMRYLWDLYPAYRNEFTPSRVKRALMVPLSNYLRLWDFASAARVDQFLANSYNVRNRIWKTYRREADVVYPPVAVDSFRWAPADDYFLIVSELVPYKRIDAAVRLFARTGRRLIIAGKGPEYSRLKDMARPNVEFAGRVSDDQLRDLYAGCRALILPGEEDFGLTPVEALASGKPVIALGRGGVRESVPLSDPMGGVFFDCPDESALGEALRRFETLEPHIQPAELQRYAQRFSEREFVRKITSICDLPSSNASRNQQNSGIPSRTFVRE
ncbi:MAG TPA: glycosyltransferase [Bryobacteraceae bacterium]|jgi:glycosyltransferase involved in cell wall biosynthesis|nr:glycosyltransferase [Bryobacteraceae bacterium]